MIHLYNLQIENTLRPKRRCLLTFRIFRGAISPRMARAPLSSMSLRRSVDGLVIVICRFILFRYIKHGQFSQRLPQRLIIV